MRKIVINILAIIVVGMGVLGATADPINIRIGISLARNATGTLGLNSKLIYNGIQYFRSWYETMPNFILSDGKECRMEIVIHENFGNSSLLLQQYDQMANDPSINFLLGPSGGDSSCATRAIVDSKKLMLYTLGPFEGCTRNSVRCFSQLTPSIQFFSSA